MTDEMINEQEEQVQDPIDIINDLRANTVSKEEFDKLKAQNAKLLKSLAKGETIEVPAVKVDATALRKELYSIDAKPLSNLDYAKKTLQLRQAILDEGGVDPFVPNGHLIAPTQEDYEAANRVASVMQECIDSCNGDSDVFTSQLQSRTRNVVVRH